MFCAAAGGVFHSCSFALTPSKRRQTKTALKAVASHEKSLLLKAHIAFVSATVFCSLLPLSRWMLLESISNCMVRNRKAALRIVLAAKHEKWFPRLLEYIECRQMQTDYGLLISSM